MKKALSVLLIAAACFGFYGSAVTVNDVLACKDYWEEAGEKSTADMNKLEDGLNQLKDNEQAYLDGQDQLAEGEKTLADGEAQYAQGLKSYKSAPAKLAEGREGLAKLRAAIKGINDLKAASGYQKWKEGYHALHENRQKLAAGAASETAAAGLAGIAAQLEDPTKTAFESAVKGLNDNDQSAAGYEQFAKDAKTVSTVTNAFIDSLQEKKDGADGIVAACGSATVNPPLPDIVAGLLNPDAEKQAKTEAGVKGILIQAAMGQGATAEQAATMAASTIADAKNVANPTTMTNAVNTIEASAQGVSDLLGTNITNLGVLKSQLTDNLALYAAAVDENLGALVDGQKTMSDGVKSLVSGILGDKTMKNNLIKKVGKAKVNSMKKYGRSSTPLSAKNGCDFAEFEKRMDTSPDVMNFLTKALPIVKARLAAGQKEYAAGLKDYKEAPAKLADAEQQLADGRQQLEDGKAQLAQYEDGEQQIRDGLATLFNTEADLDLVSIADRLNGDGDFDNGDNHLEIEEGLNAVEVGRGYQAEDGDLITAEIMGRAVATGGLLAAGVLAVLAAILSFLKKNKAAGVFALLAAAAGAFGAFFGPAQGTYFSEIAGSTIGTLTWVAAGVLGAVALVHAIVHFAAPKNA